MMFILRHAHLDGHCQEVHSIFLATVESHQHRYAKNIRNSRWQDIRFVVRKVYSRLLGEFVAATPAQ